MVISTVAIYLVLFAIVAYVQNAAFTWSSRSRNSNDPSYHRKAAWASNGVFYITNALLTLYIIKFSTLPMLVLQGFIYTLATAEGSVLMMKKLIAKEKGKQKVGNQFTPEEATALRALLKVRTVNIVHNITPKPFRISESPLTPPAEWLGKLDAGYEKQLSEAEKIVERL